MKFASLFWKTLALAAGLAIVVSPAFAATYSATDLGALPSTASGLAANDAGQVVGIYGSGYGQPFVYTPGEGAVDIGGLSGVSYTWALSINNAGQVAGRAYYSGGIGYAHAFLYTPGVGMADLGVCDPTCVVVGNTGQVAG